MKSVPYSSLAAFLAHYRALQSAASRTSDEDQIFSKMSAAIATLTPEDRDVLDSSAAAGSGRRNRERAELHLKRELVARAILSG
jgi:hypothetical protein